MGDEALSLEEQLHRGVSSLSGFKSDIAQAQAELAELDQTEQDWIKKLEYAKMNPSSTASDLKHLEDELERIGWAKEEHEAFINGDSDGEDDPEPFGIVDGTAVSGEIDVEVDGTIGVAKVVAAEKDAAEAKEMAGRLAQQLQVATAVADDAVASMLTQQQKYETEIEALKQRFEAEGVATPTKDASKKKKKK
jgi:hypothetical protein